MHETENVVKLPTANRRSLSARPPRSSKLSDAQRSWLVRGLDQPGGKLPLFDAQGQRVDQRTIRSCVENGWAQPWFKNPLKPDWLVCKLTASGREVLAEE
jgi:hypothetical protein